MYIFGQIVDATTKQPLRSASVNVLTAYYLPRFVGTLTGPDGYFDLTSNKIETTDKLAITFVGYKPITLDVSDVLYAMDIFPDNGGLFGMQPDYKELPPVVITHPPAPGKNNNAGLLLGALLLLTLATDKKKGRKVGSAERSANFIERHWKLLLIGAGVILFLPQITKIIANLLRPFTSVSNAIDALFSVGSGVKLDSNMILVSPYSTVYKLTKDFVSHHVYDPATDAAHKQYLYDHFETNVADQLFATWQQPKGALYWAGSGVNG